MTNYTLIRSRRRTLAVYVKSDGSVEVRAPLRLSKRKIEQFLISKTQWIKQKQAYFANKKPEQPRVLPILQYQSGEFEQTARELIKTWEQQLGVTATYVGFRKMSSRWGSCTAKTRRIRVNTQLAYCPRKCLEYIVVHELAHLLENNHSRRFWAIVTDALPDYKMRQKILKDSSWLLQRL